jgi:hypothetical protein
VCVRRASSLVRPEKKKWLKDNAYLLKLVRKVSRCNIVLQQLVEEQSEAGTGGSCGELAGHFNQA